MNDVFMEHHFIQRSYLLKANRKILGGEALSECTLSLSRQRLTFSYNPIHLHKV